MSEEMKLLPCPFCGSPAMRDDDDGMEAKFEGAACSKEGCVLHKFFIEDYEWNRRAPAHADEPVAQQIDRWDASSDVIEQKDRIFTAGIDDLSVWDHRIQVHANSADEAIEIRDQVLAALSARPSAGIRSEVINQCAKVCRDIGARWMGMDNPYEDGYSKAAFDCEKVIRALGESS